MPDQLPELDRDACRPVTVPVDGHDETVIVHGSGEFTTEDRDTLGELVAAAQRLMADDHYSEVRQGLTLARMHALVALPEGEVKQRLRAAVAAAMSALREAGQLRATLAELVRLKDGPRDDAYQEAKDAAWQRARALLAEERS